MAGKRPAKSGNVEHTAGFLIDALTWITFEAPAGASLEELADLAREAFEYPSLCHQCAGGVDGSEALALVQMDDEPIEGWDTAQALRVLVDAVQSDMDGHRDEKWGERVAAVRDALTAARRALKATGR